ncbi:zinc finger protein 711-like [Scaptodrosophila lebanonensis]|uniref:Zinc finger protein 711-like n=1 Tax=Drosophila lebanonensis TaxID=7225 RepID=A0A6J2TM61_DROLE|nr:zinc finger protein 711-like [Scaptodrosophila lebanonensis]
MRNARICSEHFNPADIEGTLQWEMGLRSRRTLKPGSVPCINRNDMTLTGQKREERLERRKNKQIVAELLANAEKDNRAGPPEDEYAKVMADTRSLKARDFKAHEQEPNPLQEPQVDLLSDSDDVVSEADDPNCTDDGILWLQGVNETNTKDSIEIQNDGVIAQESNTNLFDAIPKELKHEVYIEDVDFETNNIKKSNNYTDNQQLWHSVDHSNSINKSPCNDVIILDICENTKTENTVLEDAKFKKNDVATIFYTGNEVIDNMKKCRICDRHFIADGNAKDLLDEANNALLYNIEAITGIMIQFMEGLPHYICSGCFSDLDRATVFRDNCIRNERILQLYIKEQQQSSQPIEVISEIDDSDDFEEFIQLPRGEPTEEDSEGSVYSCIDLVNADEIQVEGSINQETNMAKKTQATISIDDPISAELGKTDLNNLLHEATSLEDGEKITKRGRSKREGERPKRKRKPRERMPRKLFTPEERKLRRYLQNNHLNIVCDICGHISSTRHNFNMHKLRHTKTKNFACSECPMKFYNNYMMQLHVRVKHKNEMPFKCRHCELAFKDNTRRYIHEKKIHGVGKPEDPPVDYVCKICGHISSTRHNLNMHEMRHTGIKNVECPECPMTFYNNYLMRIHIRVKHKNEKPFSCRHCDLAFTDNVQRYKHEKAHLAENTKANSFKSSTKKRAES